MISSTFMICSTGKSRCRTATLDGWRKPRRPAELMSVCLPRAQRAVDAKSGIAGGYSIELLPACIRRSRFCTRLSATAGRTVRMRCKAALRHRVRYVIAVSRFLADAARN